LAGVGRQRGQPVDLAALLNDIADGAGVRCALDNDLVYVTLLMLHGISAEGSPLRAFYPECLDRLCPGSHCWCVQQRTRGNSSAMNPCVSSLRYPTTLLPRMATLTDMT
jgi:hypothetical protein